MDLTALGVPGAHLAVRITPKASANRVTNENGVLRAYVTTVREGGKATAAVVKLLARALGIAPGRLTLIRGATARDKVFLIEG